jgi:hypothetical protein
MTPKTRGGAQAYAKGFVTMVGKQGVAVTALNLSGNSLGVAGAGALAEAVGAARGLALLDCPRPPQGG